MHSLSKASLKTKLRVIVLPPISNNKYLRHLYRELLNLSKEYANFQLYSPRRFPSVSEFFWPFELTLLLLKSRSDYRTILHIHWVEFLYQWGNHKYLTLILIPLSAFFFQFLKKFSKIKVAITVHNLLPHNIQWLHIEYGFFRKMLREMSHCIFVHSALQKKLIVKLYDLNPEKIVVIQHGLFKAPKFRDSLRSEQIRARFRISQRDVVFSFIGAISEYKGVAVLLDAMRELLNAEVETNIKLIVAGKARNAYMRYLLKKYSKVLYDKHVLFINKHLSENELETVLNLADFGICPYVNATTPATLLDFISHKLPFVTTDDRNVLGLIGEYPAIIAKRGDHLSLAQAIYHAYVNVSEYREKAKNFKDMSSFINAWRTSADITLDCYLHLARS